MTQEKNSIRERSGSVDTDNNFVKFFYLLMRDYVLPGDVEKIVKDIEKIRDNDVQFCNGWLGQHAKDVVERLGKNDDDVR